MATKRNLLISLAALATAAAFAPPATLPALASARRPAMATPPAVAAAPRRQPRGVVRQRTSAVQMGMFGLGWAEIGVIGVIALLFFGPEKLAPMAKDLGACNSRERPRVHFFLPLARPPAGPSRRSRPLAPAARRAGKSASGLKEVAESFKEGMTEAETGVSKDGGETVIKSAEEAPEKTDA